MENYNDINTNNPTGNLNSGVYENYENSQSDDKKLSSKYIFINIYN